MIGFTKVRENKMNLDSHNDIVLTEKNPIDCLLRYCDNVRLGYHPNDDERLKRIFETNGEIFYRGELIDFKTTKLTPKIFRPENLIYEESDLYIDFQATFSKYHQNFHYQMDWFSFMQHNGLPTRLLDWSINPLVALYFAISDPQYSKEDGFLYLVPILNKGFVRRHITDYSYNPIKSFYLFLVLAKGRLELIDYIKEYFFLNIIKTYYKLNLIKAGLFQIFFI